jgi:hypothetical protein
MFAAEFVNFDDPAEIVAAAFVVPLLALGLVGIALGIRDTIRQKGRWGIALKLPKCGKCGAKMPFYRKPRSWHQVLWGGWTCAECGFELDKYGAPIPDRPEPAKWKLLEAAEAEEVEEMDAAADSLPTDVKAPGQMKKRRTRKSHD